MTPAVLANQVGGQWAPWREGEGEWHLLHHRYSRDIPGGTKSSYLPHSTIDRWYFQVYESRLSKVKSQNFPAICRMAASRILSNLPDKSAFQPNAIRNLGSALKLTP
jgi:hypothetical protein